MHAKRIELNGIRTLRVVYLSAMGDEGQSSVARPILVLKDGINDGSEADNTLHVSFDEMSHDVHFYTYTVVHMDAEWSSESAILSNEYLNGYTTQDITDYEHSMNTSREYTHYEFIFPNADMTLTKSGNYQLRIYEDGDPTKRVAEVNFCVVEPLVAIDARVRNNTDVELSGRYQQLDFDVVTSALQIKDPNSAIDMGVPFTKRPTALVLDYKAKINPNGQIVYANAGTRVKNVAGRDKGQIVLVLQHRWEDNGHVYAYRVGTATEYIEQSTSGWVDGHRVEVCYGEPKSDCKQPRHELFTGCPGNVVWCDNIRLAYDYHDIEKALVELIQMVDSAYPVSGKHYIAGLSDGARIAANTANLLPGYFDAIGMFSPVVHKSQLPADSAMVFVYTGKQDLFHPNAKRFKKRLEKNKTAHCYQETTGGHNWRNWRIYLSDFLRQIALISPDGLE